MYCEKLLTEAGLGGGEALFIGLRDQLWRACRVVLDIGIHVGETSYEEAVEMLVDVVGLEREGLKPRFADIPRAPDISSAMHLVSEPSPVCARPPVDKWGTHLRLAAFTRRSWDTGVFRPHSLLISCWQRLKAAVVEVATSVVVYLVDTTGGCDC